MIDKQNMKTTEKQKQGKEERERKKDNGKRKNGERVEERNSRKRHVLREEDTFPILHLSFSACVEYNTPTATFLWIFGLNRTKNTAQHRLLRVL